MRFYMEIKNISYTSELKNAIIRIHIFEDFVGKNVNKITLKY